jgi:hypothetical protein
MIVIVRFTEFTFEIQLDALDVTAMRRCALSLSIHFDIIKQRDLGSAGTA